MLTSSAVLRRQHFLIRSLGGYNNQIPREKFRGVKFATEVTATMEADAESILRKITPTLDPNRHKGQAGKVAIIGGCREYTGAPYFAAISALKLGADLSHVFCTKDAATVIKSYSPELIVHPVLEESYSVRDDERGSVSSKVLAEVAKWMERFDCIVVGPGLGRDPFLLECVSDILKLARRLNVPIVIDGDGLFLVTNSIELVRGYHLAVLTPNVNEYKRLVQKVLDSEVNNEGAPQQLLLLAKREPRICRSDLGRLSSENRTLSWWNGLREVDVVEICGALKLCAEDKASGTDGLQIVFSKSVGSSWGRGYEGMGGATILRKGKSDLISDGETVNTVSIFGSPRRCGGQGDILSGSVAVFLAWARQYSRTAGDSTASLSNPTVLGCIAASALLRKAASIAFEDKKRATLTTDIIEHLGKSLDDICPAC